MAWQNTIRLGTNSYIKAEWGNTIGEQGSQEKSKGSETYSDLWFPLLGIPQEHQANRYTIYVEDLVQTHVGCMVATSVCVSPHEPCLVDSVCSILLVSLTLLTLTILLPPILRSLLSTTKCLALGWVSASAPINYLSKLIKKTWYIFIMEYYSAVKKYDMAKFANKWIE